MTDVDQEFENAVRSMLKRRAADVDSAVAPTASTDFPGRMSADRSPRWPLTIAAVVLVAALGAGVLVTSQLDRPVDLATDEGPVSSNPSTADSGANTPSGSAWPATPGIELIPPGALEPSSFIFGPGDDATTLAENYVADRLPDLASTPDGVSIEEVGVVDGRAVFGWSYDLADVRASGWLYLLHADGSWWVIAAVSDGVDAHRFNRNAQGLQGVVTFAGDEPLVLDLVDVETGEPFDPATGEPVPPTPAGRQLGTTGRSEQVGDEQTIEVDTPVARPQFAVRIQAVGGTTLTITEFLVPEEIAETDVTMFIEPSAADAVAAALEADDRIAGYQLRSAANTRADYRRGFSDLPDVAQIWDDAAELESISVAIATDEQATIGLIEELRRIDGVLAVARTPAPSGAPDEDQLADELVVATRSVPFRPTAVTCDAPIGVEAPPNRFVQADVALPAETASAALARYLAEAVEPPPWSTGYTELVSADGSVAFGYATEPDRYLGIVSVEETDAGWAVTEWEIVGC